MNEVQAHLLDMLKEIDSICSKYNLSYYLAGGSLVGAMRNKGFLPWDDDADVHMERKDAIKLLELDERGLLPEGRRIVSYHNFPDTPMLHWRYEDITASVLLRSTYTTTVPQGQFIDIFVLNPAPSKSADRLRFVEDFNLYWDLFSNHVIDSRRTDSEMKRYRHWKLVAKFGGKRLMHKYFRKRLFELPENESDEYSILGPWVPQPFWPKEIFGTPKRVPFEDTTVCVASHPEQMLCYAYGSNWVEVPRLIERDSHTFIIDFDIPYQEYLKTIDSVSNRKRGGKQSMKWKDAWFKCLPNRNYVNPRTNQLRLRLRALELTSEISESLNDINKQLIERNYTKVVAKFKKYFDLQWSSNASYWKLFVPLPDEILSLIWTSYFMLGDYARVNAIISRREDYSNEPLPKSIAELKRKCECADELMRALWTDFDFDKAENILETNLNNGSSVVFFRARLALDTKLNKTPDTRIDFADKALTLFPNDGELCYWKGKALLEMGNSSEAKGYFLQAENSLINGILLTKTKQILEKQFGFKGND